LFRLELRDFSHTQQVFDKMLKRAFILFGVTYAERRGELSNVGKEKASIWT